MGFTFDFNVGFIFDPFLHGGILGSFGKKVHQENPGQSGSAKVTGGVCETRASTSKCEVTRDDMD